MKTTYFIIFLAILNITAANSQWVVQNSNSSFNINSVQFINTETGFAVGDNSRFFRTTNGGQNWGTVTIPGVNVNLEVVIAKEVASPKASGARFIFVSTNGGANWTQTTFGINYQIRNFYDNGSGKIYALAYEYNNAGDSIAYARILMTTNNGTNWTEFPGMAIDESGTCTCGRKPKKPAITFVDNNTGYLATIKGIYKTTNGGNSFSMVDNRMAWIIDAQGPTLIYAGVTSGNNLLVIKSTNQGAGWTQIASIPNSGGTKGFSGMRLLPTVNKIYISVSSTDAGMDLMQQDSSVYASFDNGASWFFQSMPATNTSIFSIDFADGNTGWVVGSGGTILKTTNGGGSPTGIQIISSEVPQRFSLFQNYPNPFNPSTKIKFSVPETEASLSNVRLTIYDINGKITETLLDTRLAAGTYETDWHANCYSSGIYFCRLQSDDFHDTKRMVLMK